MADPENHPSEEETGESGRKARGARSPVHSEPETGPRDSGALDHVLTSTIEAYLDTKAYSQAAESITWSASRLARLPCRRVLARMVRLLCDEARTLSILECSAISGALCDVLLLCPPEKPWWGSNSLVSVAQGPNVDLICTTLFGALQRLATPLDADADADAHHRATEIVRVFCHAMRRDLYSGRSDSGEASLYHVVLSTGQGFGANLTEMISGGLEALLPTATPERLVSSAARDVVLDVLLRDLVEGLGAYEDLAGGVLSATRTAVASVYTRIIVDPNAEWVWIAQRDVMDALQGLPRLYALWLDQCFLGMTSGILLVRGPWLKGLKRRARELLREDVSLEDDQREELLAAELNQAEPVKGLLKGEKCVPTTESQIEALLHPSPPVSVDHALTLVSKCSLKKRLRGSAEHAQFLCLVRRRMNPVLEDVASGIPSDRIARVVKTLERRHRCKDVGVKRQLWLLIASLQALA